MMKLEGPYRVEVRGDTRTVHRGGFNTRPIAYHFERLFTGQQTAVQSELKDFGITVECVDRPFIRLTPEDVELMLADSYVPALADMDLTLLAEFANLVADKLLGVADEVSFPDVN